MTSDQARYEQVIARFDAEHAADPNREPAGGAEQPAELLYAQRMSEMLERIAPGASEAVRLAARCQHIRRWEIPRASYPQTPAGYKSWRARQQLAHAELAGEILREAGYGEELIARVGSLLKKEALKRDAEAQLLEDIVALVFFEHYLAAYVTQHSDFDQAKLTDIVRKTARKMSADGRAAVSRMLRFPEPLAPMVRDIIAGGAAP
jgi:hypothetical protein